MSTYPGTDIPLHFIGEARPLTPADWETVVARLDVPEDHLGAVLDVETGPGGGFDPHGRPWALFEHGVFRRRTRGRFDDVAHDISKPGWGAGYGPSHVQIDRLIAAMALDRTEALQSVSLGDGQVMGFNGRRLGYDSVEAFAAAMCESEAHHLDAVARYIERTGLVDAIRDFDTVSIAEQYNGSGQVEYYAGLLAEALAARIRRRGPRAAQVTPRPPRTLRRGLRGRDVVAAQQALTEAGFRYSPEDGVFGPLTEAAVRNFQCGAGLVRDGIIGPLTRAALGL